MKRFAVVAALFSTAAFAQSALVVTCADCASGQGIEVAIDGRLVSTGVVRTTIRAEVPTGNHAVQVWKVTGANREEVASQVLSFKQGTDLKVSALDGKLEVYGNGKLVVSPPKKAKKVAKRIGKRVARLDTSILRQ